MGITEILADGGAIVKPLRYQVPMFCDKPVPPPILRTDGLLRSINLV